MAGGRKEVNLWQTETILMSFQEAISTVGPCSEKALTEHHRCTIPKPKRSKPVDELLRGKVLSCSSIDLMAGSVIAIVTATIHFRLAGRVDGPMIRWGHSNRPIKVPCAQHFR